MGPELLAGISLTASFLAGAMALFAPCCITFLFPSYLGTIFSQKSRVMYYTLVFAAGLASVIIPIALGFRAAIDFLDLYHPQIYYAGALVMILMGILLIKPIIRFPMLFEIPKKDRPINTPSIFGLGVMSGLTSSCCAPVLFAAVTLISISPSTATAIVIAMAYVAGIVMPLFLMSILYEKVTGKIEVWGKLKVSSVMKKASAILFILTGLIIAWANWKGLIQMQQDGEWNVKVRTLIFGISKITDNMLLDATAVTLIAVSIYILYLKYGKNEY